MSDSGGRAEVLSDGGKGREDGRESGRVAQFGLGLL